MNSAECQATGLTDVDVFPGRRWLSALAVLTACLSAHPRCHVFLLLRQNGWYLMNSTSIYNGFNSDASLLSPAHPGPAHLRRLTSLQRSASQPVICPAGLATLCPVFHCGRTPGVTNDSVPDEEGPLNYYVADCLLASRSGLGRQMEIPIHDITALPGKNLVHVRTSSKTS